jgi:Ca2+-binding EF-hand superfamily protein
MKLLRTLPLIVSGLLLVSSPTFGAPHQGDPIKLLDTDNDGTIDLMEAKKAAAAQFAKLDTDHEGTLDARELRGRLSAKALKAADPDKDNTLTMDEYLAVVTQRFNTANADNDGTLDAKELATPAGRALLQLLR